MYSKQEASQLKKEFWTVFGQYMTPVLSAEGEKISWINYKTGVKDIYFRMNADAQQGTVALQLSHTDEGLQQLYYKQLLSVKKVLEQTAGNNWIWQRAVTNEYGKTISQVTKYLPNVSIYKKEDWPALITFFKNNIIALDEFWSGVKYGFEALR